MARFAHRLDPLLIATFAAFAATSFLFDRAAALDLVAADSPDPFGRMVHAFGVQYDPLVAANPLFLRVMSGISAFVYGPFYIWLCTRLWQRKHKLDAITIAYVATMLYSLVVHVVVELRGDEPPPNLLIFAGIYIPYAVAPLLLLVRDRGALRGSI